MELNRVLELMKIETECIKRANTCDRNCAKCELVQKDTDLLEAYGEVIDMLEAEIESMNSGIQYK